MASKVSRVRMMVFYIWFLTLAVVVAVYVERMVGWRDLAPPTTDSLFQSFQMMVGLILPQLAVISAFYLNFDQQRDKIESLSSEQITIITTFSLAYHIIFIASVIGGISFHAFDSTPDGHMLDRNTAKILALMGLFSLFLAPVAFLFTRPGQTGRRNTSSRPSSEQAQTRSRI